MGELAADNPRRERLRERLARVGDPERLLTRAVLGTLTPREAAALRDGLAEVPASWPSSAELCRTPALLSSPSSPRPIRCPDLHAELARMLEEAPAPNLQDGGVIAAGVDEELDRYRSLARDSKRHILALETRERERTGISSLKIRYNKVFGYYLEITRANQERVPADYIRKQTLVNAERYVTPRSRSWRSRSSPPRSGRSQLEQRALPASSSATIAAAAAGLTALAAALGTLDALAAFAEVAARQRYVRPDHGDRRRADRHPRRAPSGGGAGEPRRLRAQRRRARRRAARRSCS